jgi:hypothetical protein
MAWSVYLLLRLLATERVHAGAIAVLLLVFPAADSVRLWAGAAAGQLTVTFVMLGLVLAVLAFRREGRVALALHGASLLLYLASILLHESTLVLIGAAVLLYRAIAPWRASLTRWAVDVGACALTVLTVTTRSSAAWPRQDLAGQLDHARAISDQAVVLLTSVALPFGSGSWLAILPLLLVLLAAAYVVRRLDRDDPARSDLLRWLAIVGAGVVVVVAGYLIYVPAISYYVPAATGIANRMNVLPSVGYVLIAYGVVVLACILAFRTFGNRRALVAGFAVAGALILCLGYLDRLVDDIRRFDRAYALGADVISGLGAVPQPPSGTTIFSAGQPIEVEPGFPVFGNTWDLSGAVRVLYNDDSLTGLPYFPGTTLACHADGLEPVNPRYGTDGQGNAVRFRPPYGKVLFYDAPSRRYELVTSRRQCLTIAERFRPGPEYAPVAG